MKLTAALLALALAGCATAEPTQQDAKADLRLYAAGITDQMISSGQCVVRPEFRNVDPNKLTKVVVDQAIKLSVAYRQKHGDALDAGKLFRIAVEYVMEKHVCQTRRT